MGRITTSATREIIDDFAKEIRHRRMQTAKPSKAVINFRTDVRDGVERDIWRVPVELLRYRKDNGRIASDVADHERNVGPIDEQSEEGQAQIAQFLQEKDTEQTGILRRSIMHAGQMEPAIITCDGFLINGNRRKLVMDRLRKEHPDNDSFGHMKVVILPGRNDEGGPPTLLEIERIENRYQLQSDGKAEYYGFDRALSIKRKIEIGLTLEDQLRDDPRFAEATQVELQKAVRECEKSYLEPLACVDRYLKQFKREGQYRTISAGMSDKAGRWQAFLDYSNYAYSKLSNDKRRIELGVEEAEVGSIEEAAFDIIRLRTVPEMPKIHMVMRELPKYCSTRDGKREVMKIAEDVEPVLPRSQCLDEHSNELKPEEVDAKWAAANKETITWRLKKARDVYQSRREKETPLDLLEAAYQKLSSETMDMRQVELAQLPRARQLTSDIRGRLDEIEKDIYQIEKELKKLHQKKS